MSIVVYTAIFGQLNDPLLPAAAHAGCGLVCFTDRPDLLAHPPPNWDVRPAVIDAPTPRRRARAHKLLSHLLFPDAAATLWVDSNLTLIADPADIAARHREVAIYTFRHRRRDCIYDELDACVRMGKDDPAVMAAQVQRYRDEGYPAHGGLAETSAMLRWHRPEVAEVNAAWEVEVRRGSCRDQLSFDYVIWRLQRSYAHLPGTRYDNPYFRYQRHRKGIRRQGTDAASGEFA